MSDMVSNGYLKDKNGKVMEIVDKAARDGVERLTEEMARKDKPLVYIDGEIPTTKDNVLAEMRVVSGWLNFHAYIKIKCQGTSSMNYQKKNFTVTLYQDKDRTIPLYITIPGWKVASNKFVFKANYIDHSHARNINAARLWGEIVKTRADYDTLPVEFRNSPNNGAIDGFPILVTTNGNYQGLYTWNIGKDAWMWGMDEDNPNHVLLCAETNTDGVFRETTCNFRALWNGIDEQGWSVEVGTNSEAVKNSLNTLIACVKDTDDATFKATIGNYLDVNSAIDYYLFQYYIFGSDNLAKNMLLATYDGKKWMCGAYDLDSILGLSWQGSIAYPPTARIPEDAAEKFSLLWVRLEECFYDELKARYTELRNGPLSIANAISKFEAFIRGIGTETYAEDLTAYPTIPIGSENNLKQIRDYIRDRTAYVDEQIAALAKPIRCTGISVEPKTVSFATSAPRTLAINVTPADCTELVTYASTDETVAYVYNGMLYPVTDGECTITVSCGAYSATISVTVSAFGDEIDYTHNALANAEWEEGSYSMGGGGTKAEADAFRTVNNNVVLQDCLYKFEFAAKQGNYVDVFAYDRETGAYVSGFECYDATGWHADHSIIGNSNHKYALKVNNPNGNFSGNDIRLVAVDNRETAVAGFEIDLSNVTAEQLASYRANAWEYDVTAQFASAGLHDASVSYTRKINKASVNIDGTICVINAGKLTNAKPGFLSVVGVTNVQTNGVWASKLILYYFGTAEECATYLRENAVKVAFNQ